AARSFTPPPTRESFPLSLHDALPISLHAVLELADVARPVVGQQLLGDVGTEPLDRFFVTAGDALEEVLGEQQDVGTACAQRRHRSEEHTSELQSRENLVCRLRLEKKK